MKATCPQCSKTTDLGARVGLKVGAAVGVTLIGGTSKSWLGALLGAALGGVVGHAIDTNVLPSCEVCQVVLRLVDQVS
jgi:outer membrane lipoprotein SlyB